VRLWPRVGSPYGVGLAVAVGVFALYQVTFSSVPVSDALTYSRFIDSGDYSRILFPNSMLTTFSFFQLRRLLAAVGFAPPTIELVRTVNALSAALSGFLFYRIVFLLGGGAFWGAVGAGLLAGSYGFWYFANGEMHHLAMVFVLLVFYLLLRRRVLDEPITPAFVCGVALLNVAAGFFHQEHFAFGLTAVALLVVARPWRQGARDAALYTGSGIAGSAAVLLAMGGGVLGLRSLDAIRRWYFWQLDYLAQEYTPEHPLVIVARLVKGQLTAWLFGTQVLVDAMRRPELFRYARVPAFAGLTILACGAAALLLWQGRRSWRGLPAWFVPLLIAASVWLLSYPVLFAWYFPAVTEYYLKTVPPLILLLLLGAVEVERRVLARGTAVVLLLLVLGVNFSSAIWPWYRYGRAISAFEGGFNARFRADDLFISFESGLDNTIKGRTRFLALKGLFDREGRERGFQWVREAVESQLGRDGRVFAYNLVPGPFSIKTLNDHLRNSRVARYRPEDFQAFLEELQRRYAFREILSYWEEAHEPLYLFGERLQPLWEIREIRQKS
jgi:hypothetical protein